MRTAEHFALRISLASAILLGQSRVASLIALGALVGMIGFGLLLPIYSDEIVWRFHERAAIDGGFDVWLNDNCGTNTIARAPWFMMPARWFSATMNLALPSPLFVRIEGVLCALAWLALLWRLIGRVADDNSTRDIARTLSIALLSLGVLPLLLVMSRPEQVLILANGSIIALSLPHGNDRPNPTSAVAWFKCATIVFLATIGLSYHIKGVLYAVVAMACLAVCARGSRTLAPRLMAGATLAVLTVLAFRYWSARFACPEDPMIAQALANQNLAALLANGGGITSLSQRLLLNALPLLYVVPAIPSTEPISSWLPPQVFSPGLSFVFRIAGLTIWTAAGGLALWAMARSIATKGLSQILVPRRLIALAILACLLVWGLSQVTKNMYEAAHVLPLAALAIVLMIGSDGAATSRLLGGLTTVSLAAALISQVVVAALLAKPFTIAAASQGPLPTQPLSLAAFHYGEIRSDIVSAMRAAGMHEPLERPVIDDASYLALQQSHLPFHVLGVFGPWRGTITDPADFLLPQLVRYRHALCQPAATFRDGSESVRGNLRDRRRSAQRVGQNILSIRRLMPERGPSSLERRQLRLGYGNPSRLYSP